MRQTFNFPNKPLLFLSVALPAIALSLISPSNDTTEERSRLYQTAQTGAKQFASDRIDQLMSLNVLFPPDLTLQWPAVGSTSVGFSPLLGTVDF